MVTTWTERHSDHGPVLVRELRFRDFAEAIDFVERVADAAVDYDRRPDMCISAYNHVTLTVGNLHHGAITAAEQRLAAKVDAIVEDRFRHA
jgi:4a-hydroxytetrahydrobiopterin dehydratase